MLSLRRIMYIALGIFVMFIVVMIIAVKYSIWLGGQQAVEIAEGYLAKEYGEEMIYWGDVEYIMIEASRYYLTFNPAKNPDLAFTVSVPDGVKLGEYADEYNNAVSDNYYIRYFEYYCAKRFYNDFKKIWGTNVGTLFVDASPLDMKTASYKKQIVNGELSLSELKSLFEPYYIRIGIDYRFDETIKASEAQKIYDFIIKVNQSGLALREIHYSYRLSTDDEENLINIYIKNLTEITSIEQVIEQIDAQYQRRK